METLKPQFKQMRDALLHALQALKIIPKTFIPPMEGLAPSLPTEHFRGDATWVAQLAGTPWIAIAPGASYETKQAPLEIFSESLALLRQFLKSSEILTKLGLLFLGDERDLAICEKLSSAIQWQGPTLNLAGKLSLWENSVALRQTICLLSNDSALGHIAEAVETPILVLFGPTVEGFGFAPRKKESRAFSSLIGCRPCSKHGKAQCRFGDKLCFWQISREDIASHMKDLIYRVESRH